MNAIQFFVQGSSIDPYRVTFQKDGQHLSALCTCPAGVNGQYCKHRFAILNGEDIGIVSNNQHEVEIVASWLADSDVEAALVEVKQAEVEFERAKKVVASAKKKVAAIMRS